VKGKDLLLEDVCVLVDMPLLGDKLLPVENFLVGDTIPPEDGPHLLVDMNVGELHLLGEMFHHLVEKLLLSVCHSAFDGLSLPSYQEYQNPALGDTGPLLEDMDHLLEDMGPLLEDIHQY